MKWYQNLRVSGKLIVAFAAVFAIVVIMSAMALVSLGQTSREASRIFDNYGNAQGYLGNTFSGFATQYIFLGDMERYRDPSVSEELHEIVMQIDVAVDEALDEYKKRCISTEDKAEAKLIETELSNFRTVREEFFAYINAEDYENARVLLMSERMENICYSLDAAVTAAKENNVTQAAVALDQQNQSVVLFTWILIILIVLVALTTLLSVLLITKSISKPLRLLSAFMKKAGSTGDISLTMDDIKNIGEYSQTKDEIGQTIADSVSFVNHVTNIAKELESVADGDLTAEVVSLSDKDVMGLSLKKMMDNLNNMFSEIQASTAQVSIGSTQVADGAQSLAQGSTEQASSIEELSSSIADIADRTKANAATANKTSVLSATIKGDAEKGSLQMNEMIKAVGEINEASKNISKIIKTIDDIAFQTNILALNAAVEAARAGQYGKGFAVVAEEVRNLASKSAEAAKDTGDMIQNSMDKAELGTRIAGETAASLKEIVSGINEAGQLINEIVQASEEQAYGISQINIGIDQVAQVVQQNSATAEESASASEEMSGQSAVLQQLIAQFKLKDGVHSLPPSKMSAQERIAMPRETGYALTGRHEGFGKY